MGEAKRRKALDPNYGKGFETIIDGVNVPTEKVIEYFVNESKISFSDNLLECYSKYLEFFDIEPSQDIIEYSIEKNPDYFRVFGTFFIIEKDNFDNVVYTIATKLKYKKTPENIKKIMSHIWILLGFRLCQFRKDKKVLSY